MILVLVLGVRHEHELDAGEALEALQAECVREYLVDALHDRPAEEARVALRLLARRRDLVRYRVHRVERRGQADRVIGRELHAPTDYL